MFIRERTFMNLRLMALAVAVAIGNILTVAANGSGSATVLL